jgi:hypothetical protein
MYMLYCRAHGKGETVWYMGKHGKDPSIWVTVLGLLAVACVAAAITLLFVGNPRWGMGHQVCQYASGSVTIEIDGPDCIPVIRAITGDTDRAWATAAAPQGSVYSQLVKGKDVVRIYDHGDPVYARALSGYLQKARWAVVAPSPAPS